MKKLLILIVAALFLIFCPFTVGAVDETDEAIGESCSDECVQLPFTEEEILAFKIQSHEQFGYYVFQVVSIMENGQFIIYMAHSEQGIYRFAFLKDGAILDYAHCSLHGQKCWHEVSGTLDQTNIDYLMEKLGRSKI